MVRGLIGIVVGAVAWMAGFFAQVFILVVIWRDVEAPGRRWMTESVSTFTTPMACFLLLFWALAAVGAGWVAMKIAKRREAVWVMAGLIEAYVVALHIVLFWSTFPWWYNLGVVIPAVPAILLGAKWATRSRAAVGAVAA